MKIRKRIKNALTILMTMVLLFQNVTVVNTKVEAEGSYDTDWVQVEDVGGSKTITLHGSSDVEISKTIEPLLDGNGNPIENYFDITLEVASPPHDVVTENSIVIVLDVSNTMNRTYVGGGSTLKIDDAKTSAKTFINEVANKLASSNDIYNVGIVTFNRDADTVLALTEVTSSNASSINSKINGITAPTDVREKWTNVEGGLQRAYDMLAADTDADNKYVILLTDGFPTTYIDRSSYTKGSSSIAGYTPIMQYSPYWSSYSGTRKAFQTWCKNNRSLDGVFYDNVKGYASWDGVDYSDKGALKAQNVATAIKNAGINIFTVGIDIGGMNIATEGKQGTFWLDDSVYQSTLDREHDGSSTPYVIESKGLDMQGGSLYGGWLKNEIAGGVLKNNYGGTWYWGASSANSTLNEAYASILHTIEENSRTPFRDGTIVDPMGDNIDFLGFYNGAGTFVPEATTTKLTGVMERYSNGGENEVSFANNTIDWKVTESGWYDTGRKTHDGRTIWGMQLKYRVRLTNEASGYVFDDAVEENVDERPDVTNDSAASAYPSNDTTTFKFRDWETHEWVSNPPELSLPVVEGYSGELKIVKMSELSGKPLSGATFVLSHDASECTVCHGDAVIADVTRVSGADGVVEFTNIPSGHNYTLTETKSPDYYQANSETYDVDVLYNVTYFEGEKHTVTEPESIINKPGDPEPVSASLSVDKVFAGLYAEYGLDTSDVFEFTVSAITEGAPLPSDVTAENNAEGQVVFGDITFDKAGIYEYKIEETSVNPAWSADTKIYVTVEVLAPVKGQDNQLIVDKITYTNESGANDNAITNTYVVPVPVKTSLSIDKTVTGVDAPALTADLFEFTLTAQNNAPLPAVTVVKNDAEGHVNFGEMTYTHPGVYTYFITETDPVTVGPGWSNTTGVVVAKVTVELNDQNELVVSSVAYTDASNQSVTGVTNQYTGPAPVDVSFSIDKELSGYSAYGDYNLKDEVFEFEVKAVTEGAPLPKNTKTNNTVTGDVDFGAITFTEAGTYEYQITENYTGNKWAADAAIDVVVTVVEPGLNQENKLIVSSVVYKKNGSVTEDPTIINEFEIPTQTTAVLEIEKQVTGKTVDAEEMKKFEFTLTAQVGSPMPTEERQVVVYSDEYGVVKYPAITFTMPGTYTYRIVETDPAGIDPGWTNSTGSIYAEVVVTINSQHQLEATVKYLKDDPTAKERILVDVTDHPVIVNTFTEPASVSTSLEIDKTLAGFEGFGSYTLANTSFDFVLSAQQNAPLPSVTTVKNDALGNVKFGNIEFTEPGTYVYTITESSDNTSWKADTEVTVTVTVDAPKVGQSNRLVVTSVVYTDKDGNKTEGIVNTYQIPEEIEVPVSVKKVIGNHGEGTPELTEGMFNFELLPLNQGPLPSVTQVTNAVDGTVSFGEITFEKPGTYSYEIQETGANSLAYSWTNMTGSIYVDIVVSAVNEGSGNELTYTIAYTNHQGVETAVIENHFENPNQGSALIEVSKNLIDVTDPENPSEMTMDVPYTFILTPVGEAPMPEGVESLTTHSGVGGHVEFHLMDLFNQNDIGETYWYTIQEADVENPMVDKDSRVIYVQVEVGYASDNAIHTTVSYVSDMSDSATDVEPVFTNSYTQPKETSIQLQLIKNVVDLKGHKIAFEDEEYKFELKALTAGAPMPDNPTAIVKQSDLNGDGLVKFDPIQFVADKTDKNNYPKTYRYSIQEIAGDNPSISYSTETIIAEVKVDLTEVDGKPVLTSEVTYSNLISGEPVLAEDNQAVVKNVYTTPEPVSVAIEIDKKLAGFETYGRYTLADSVFTFDLFEITEESETRIASATNTVEGHVKFDEITYTESGTHDYVIRERDVEGDAWKPDTEIYVTVKIDDPVKPLNKLISSVVYTTAEGTVLTSPVITNHYQTPASAKIELEILKKIEGEGAPELKENMFEFTLERYYGTDTPENPEAIVSAKNDENGKVVFDEKTFNQVGNYYYIVKEVPQNDASWSNITGNIYVLIEVQVDPNVANGHRLIAIPSYYYANGSDNVNAEIVNHYTSPGKATVVIEGTKVLMNGEEEMLMSEGYSFTLTPVDQAPMPEDKTSLNVTSGTDGKFRFALTDVYEDKHVGKEYKYQIVENAGSNTSIDYTEEKGYAYVLVEKTTDNTLKTTVRYEMTEGTELVFVNEYTKPESVEVNLEVLKELTGRTLKDKEFTFVLTAVTADAPLPENGTVKNTGDGTVEFGPIVYEAKETDKTDYREEYVYVISEVIPASEDKDASITYSEEDITVTVVITRDGNENKLVSEVIYASDDDTAETLTNVYTKPESTVAKIEVTKVLQGLEGFVTPSLEGGEFTFELSAVGNAPLPSETEAVNDLTGHVVFEEIEYTEAGTYRYVITETSESPVWKAAGNGKVEAAVVIGLPEKGAENKLVVKGITYSYEGLDGTFEEGEIVNQYQKPEPVKVHFEIDKAFTGSYVPENMNGMFEFTLSTLHGSPLPSNVVETNNAEGKVVFDEITYEYPGTYNYYVTETNPKTINPSWSSEVNFVEIAVVISVDSTEGKHELTADVSYSNHAKIYNHYQIPEPTDASFELTKVVKDWNGEVVESVEDYTFVITPVNDAPVPAVTEVTTENGTAEFNFGTIFTDEHVGKTLTYEVSEVQGTHPGMNYSEEKGTVSVTVMKTLDNVLETIVVCEPEALVFTNTLVESESAKVQLEAEKILDGKDLDADEYTFVLSALDNAPLPLNTEVTNRVDGKIVFDEIEIEAEVTDTLDYERTYYYQITEVKGDNPSITYDQNAIDVKVTVRRNAENKLETEVVYTKVTKVAEETDTQFVNVYTAPEPIGIEIEGVKRLLNEGVEMDQDAAYEFKLSAVDDAPLPENLATVLTDSTKTFKFDLGSIFTDEHAGKTFEYQVTEVAGLNPSITYSEEIGTVMVEITKKSDNTLSAEITYQLSGQDVEELVFTNVYTVPESLNVNLELVKNVIGEGYHGMSEGDFTFTIASVTQDAPLPQLQTVSNNEFGLVAFGPIEFVEAPSDHTVYPVVYEYVITENDVTVNPSIAKDPNEIKVTVTVTKTSENQLDATVEYLKESKVANEAENVFVNVYEKPEPVEVMLKVQKTLRNAKLNDKQFSFTLKPLDDAPGVEMTKRNDASGLVTFDTIVFEENELLDWGIGTAKTFKYEIKEVQDGQSNVRYDSGTVIASVTIIKNEENQLEVAEIKYLKNEIIENNEFVNDFKAPDTSDPSSIGMWSTQMTISGLLMILLAVFKRKTKKA